MRIIRETLHTRPRIEGLECRAVPAGNVSVSVSDGVVSIVGDAAANQISVQHDSAGNLSIIGLNGTTVNGLAGVYAGRGVPAQVLMDMGAGNDYLEVAGLYAGRIAAQGGSGADRIWMVNAGSYGNVEVAGGDDNDLVFVSGVVAQGVLSLDGGAGSDGLHVDTSGGYQGSVANNFEGSF